MNAQRGNILFKALLLLLLLEVVAGGYFWWQKSQSSGTAKQKSENTALSAPVFDTTAESKRNQIKICGDFPDVIPTGGRFDNVQFSWSPDCGHIAWSRQLTSPSYEGPDSSQQNIVPWGELPATDKEGVFILDVKTNGVDRVYSPTRKSELAVFTRWIDSSSFIYRIGDQEVEYKLGNKTISGETADWKTFINDYYSLSYPASWKVTKSRVSIENGQLSDTTFSEQNTDQKLNISIVKSLNAPSGPSSRTEEGEIGGQKVTKTYRDSSLTGGPYLMDVFLRLNGKDYYFSAENSNNNFDSFNEILSTFKFL